MSFEQARAAIRAVLDARGAHWVEPPLLQPAAIYLELYGEQIRRRVFLIEDAGRGMCLRPDLTAPAVRAAFELNKTPALVAYDGRVFRRAPPGPAKGRPGSSAARPTTGRRGRLRIARSIAPRRSALSLDRSPRSSKTPRGRFSCRPTPGAPRGAGPCCSLRAIEVEAGASPRRSSMRRRFARQAFR